MCVRRGQQTAAARGAHQLRGCELPGWPLPARKVLPERDAQPLFVRLRLLAQRGLRLGAAGERFSASRAYRAAQHNTHVFRVLLRRCRALHRVQPPMCLVRVARQAQRLVIPAQCALLIPGRAVRGQRARRFSAQRAAQAKTQGRRLTSPPFQAARRAAARDSASCASPPAHDGTLVKKQSEACACATRLRRNAHAAFSLLTHLHFRVRGLASSFGFTRRPHDECGTGPDLAMRAVRLVVRRTPAHATNEVNLPCLGETKPASGFGIGFQVIGDQAAGVKWRRARM